VTTVIDALNLVQTGSVTFYTGKNNLKANVVNKQFFTMHLKPMLYLRFKTNIEIFGKVGI